MADCPVNNNRGFTLIEVLLGTSLLAVMLLLMFASLRICIQNWDAGEKKISQVNQMAVVQRFFNSYLQGIRPLEDSFSDEEPMFSFQGSENQLQFVTAMPASAGRMGLQSFVIGLQSGGRKAGKDMVVSITPFFPLLEGKQWKQEQVVAMEGVENVRFSYFGAEEIDEQPEWKDQWLEMETLPLLIAVMIEMTDGEVLPQIVVAPRNKQMKPVSRNLARRRGLVRK